MEGKEEVLKQEYTDKSMVAAGFTICQCFRGFMGMVEGDRRKGRGLYYTGLAFTIKSEDLLPFWERIWGGERKEEDLKG